MLRFITCVEYSVRFIISTSIEALIEGISRRLFLVIDICMQLVSVQPSVSSIALNCGAVNAWRAQAPMFHWTYQDLLHLPPELKGC